MFRRPVDIEIGEISEREGFVYADVLPVTKLETLVAENFVV